MESWALDGCQIQIFVVVVLAEDSPVELIGLFTLRVT